jgi:hydrogenase-1 operon protein HyaF
MSKLEEIPVRVEFNRPKAAKPDVVNLVLHEIHGALSRYQASGQTHSIDLRQLPRMSPTVYQSLRDALSQGEVTAIVDAEIKVEVTETQYPGVWWLRHLKDEEITAEVIEITEMPVILKPHRVDIIAGLNRLGERLQTPVSQTEPVPVSG